jgi:hypothetical protein
LVENGPTVVSRTSSTSTPLPDCSICWIFWSAWFVGGEISCTLTPEFFASKSAISFLSSAVRVGLVRLSTICRRTSPFAFSAGPGPQADSSSAAAVAAAARDANIVRGRWGMARLLRGSRPGDGIRRCALTSEELADRSPHHSDRSA